MQDVRHKLSCPRSLCGGNIAGSKEFLVPPGSRTPEQFNADLRDLDRLPELRKRLAAETKLFSDSEHPLSKKAEQMGFSKSSGHVRDTKETQIVLQPSNLLQHVDFACFRNRSCSLLLGRRSDGQASFNAGRVELMHPHLIKGKELPHDLEDWGKRMLAWVYLSARVSGLEELKKVLSARASKSSERSGMFTVSALHSSSIAFLQDV